MKLEMLNDSEGITLTISDKEQSLQGSLHVVPSNTEAGRSTHGERHTISTDSNSPKKQYFIDEKEVGF